VSWKDKLVWADESNKQRKKASFRNATFFVSDVERNVGRKNVVHQYPFKDDPYVEDLGRDGDEFTINGYVVQNTDNSFDYIAERDALIKALREEGPGSLIHPYYGELNVSLVGKARVSESFKEGGIASFTMTFMRVPDSQRNSKSISKKSITDYRQAVDNAADQCRGQAKDGFAKIYNIADTPDFTKNSIMDSIDSLNLMLKTVAKGVQGAFPAQASQALKYLSESYAGIDLNTIADTCEFAASIEGMFNGLKSITGLYGEILSDELLGTCSDLLYGYYSGPMSAAQVKKSENNETTGFSDSTMSGTSEISEFLGRTAINSTLEVNKYGETKNSDDPSFYGGQIQTVSVISLQRAIQSANLIAMTNLTRANALALATQQAVRIAYSSYDTAVAIMNKIVEEIDNFLLKLGDDSADTLYDDFNITISDPLTYNGVEQLRGVFVEAMKGIGAALPIPYDYKVPYGIISSLELAYNKYLDLDRETEIISRNLTLITNPAFLPSGKEISLIE